MRHLVATLLTAMAIVARGSGGLQEPKVQILAPEEGGYASGEVRITAAVQPTDATVERVTFFVDGRPVCTVERAPFECTWNAGAAIREHVIRVVAYLSGGRRAVQSIRTRGVEFAESTNVDVVHVTVAVLDGSRFVHGLSRDQFRVYEDDVPQPITYFGAENVALELVTDIDISESMNRSIGQVKQSVKRFLAALRPTDRVTVAAFNENFFVLAPPSADLATRQAAVDRLDPWGATSLHDVIVRSFDLLGSQAGRRGMVVFTDGDDTFSRVTRDAVERRAETSDAVLYMIGQGAAVQSAPLRKLCETLAEKSGGRAFFPRTIDELQPVFDEIVTELSNQYLIAYAAPSPRRDSTWHRIRVELPGSFYRVRARQGYRFR